MKLSEDAIGRSRVEPDPTGNEAVRKLLGRGSIYTVATAAQLSAFVVVLPVITRMLGPSDYGVVATAQIVLQILLVGAALGLPSVAAWDIYERGENGVDGAKRLVATCGLVALVVVAAIHATGPIWTRPLAELSYGRPLEIAVWSAVPGIIVLACQAVLQAQDRPGWYVACAVTTGVGGQVIGLALLAAFGGGPSAYLLGVLIGSIAGAVMGCIVVQIAPFRFASLRRVIAAVRHGGPTVPHGIAFLVLAAGDRFIIEALKGLGAVGRYQIAYLIGSLGMTALVAFNNGWAPLIYSLSESRRWDVLAHTSAAVVSIAATVAAGLAVGAPLVLVVMAPRSYDPSSLAPVSAIVAATVIVHAGYLSGAHVVFSLKRAAILAWSTPFAAVLNVTLNFVLIPAAGLVGAASATLIAYIPWAAVVLIGANRMATVPWHRRDNLRACVIGALWVGFAAVAPASRPWLILRGICCAFLLIVLIKQIRAFVIAESA